MSKQLTQDVGGRVISSGCDYLAFSLHERDLGVGDVMSWFDEKMRAEIVEYGEPKPLKHGCYQGWKSRHYFRGSDNGRVGFTVSSGPCVEALEFLLSLGIDPRLSRCDLRVDTQHERDPQGFALSLHQKLRAIEQRNAAWSRRSLELHEDKSGADSIYIGARRGDYYLLRYHKSLQDRSIIAKNVLRDELRFKDDHAKRLWEVLRAGRPQAQVAIDASVNFYANVGIDPCYDVPAEEFRLPVLDHKSDDEMFVQWFVTNIAPRVASIENPELREQMARAAQFGTFDIQKLLTRKAPPNRA